MAIHMPFDLQYWFVDILSGSNEIFGGLALLIISLMCAKYQMPYIVTMILFLLFTVFMFGSMFSGIGTILVIIAGIIGGWILARIFKT